MKLNGGASGPAGAVGADLTGEDVDSVETDVAMEAFESFGSGDLAGVDWVEDRIGSIVQASYVEGESGLEPSGDVYVVVDASDSRYYKFMVTSLELSPDGTPSRVGFRAAEID